MSFKSDIFFPQKINCLSHPPPPIQSKILPLQKSAFNSKLFFDLGTVDENDYNNESFNSTTKTDDSENFDDDDYYLSNELISELDMPTPPLTNQKSDNIILNSLVPLINNGYEFVPKNYNSIKEKKTKATNKKIDWICAFCGNLNYSFRTKCNRCKVSRDDSDNREKINMMYKYNNYKL